MKFRILFTLLLLSAIPNFAQQDVSSQVAKLKSLLRNLDLFYVDTVDVDKITEIMIEAALKELDPHSVYIPKDEVKAANEPLEGNFEGVGIQFNILDDTLLVVATIIGGPSEKLGILAGDKILSIDGKNVAGIGLTNNDVVKQLRGKKGTAVMVEIKRGNEPELIPYIIIRDKIPIYSVDASYMVNPTTGYIKLSRFAATTMDEMNEKFAELKKLGMKDLILDLTGNTGGYLHIANQLSDQFLGAGELIVYTQGKYFARNDSKASAAGVFEKGKLIVMVDASSASASEIVAGAVQDHDRGLIVGRRSFGKGLVQKPFDFPDTSVMRLTIQRYYSPSGRCIQKPYTDYESDYTDRYESGEFFHKDSVKIADSSLVYFTDNGRKVYGGGGIIPDVFVGVDTTLNSVYYRDILRKGIFNSYSLHFLDSERKNIETTYKTMQDFDGYTITEEHFAKFIAYAKEKGLEPIEKDIATSKKLLKTYLKAYIARGIWGINAFYYVSNLVDPMYLKSIEALGDGTYEKERLRK